MGVVEAVLPAAGEHLRAAVAAAAGVGAAGGASQRSLSVDEPQSPPPAAATPSAAAAAGLTDDELISPRAGAARRRSWALRDRGADKAAALRALFGLGPGEELLGEYLCALRTKVLLQGRLYVFSRHLGFHAGLFGYSKTRTIPLAAVLDVGKRTNCGFPNSISVAWADPATGARRRDFFTSFLSREDAFQTATARWAASSAAGAARAAERAAEAAARAAAAAAAPPRRALLRGRSRGGSAPPAGDASPGERSRSGTPEPPPAPSGDASSSPEPSGAPPPSASPAASDGYEDGGVFSGEESDGALGFAAAPPDGGERPSFAAAALAAAPPPPPPHAEMRLVGAFALPCASTEAFWDAFFSGGSGFFRAYHEAQGHSAVSLTPWRRHAGVAGRVRLLRFVKQLRLHLGPPEALCHQTQRYAVHAGGRLVFETSQAMPDIPYGEYFTVETRWDVAPARGGAPGVGVEVRARVPFSRSTVWRRFIERSVDESLGAAFDTLRDLAAKTAAAAAPAAAGDAGGAAGAPAPPRPAREPRGPARDSRGLPASNEEWEALLAGVDGRYRDGLRLLRRAQLAGASPAPGHRRGASGSFSGVRRLGGGAAAGGADGLERSSSRELPPMPPGSVGRARRRLAAQRACATQGRAATALRALARRAPSIQALLALLLAVMCAQTAAIAVLLRRQA